MPPSYVFSSPLSFLPPTGKGHSRIVIHSHLMETMENLIALTLCRCFLPNPPPYYIRYGILYLMVLMLCISLDARLRPCPSPFFPLTVIGFSSPDFEPSTRSSNHAKQKKTPNHPTPPKPPPPPPQTKKHQTTNPQQNQPNTQITMYLRVLSL